MDWLTKQFTELKRSYQAQSAAPQAVMTPPPSAYASAPVIPKRRPSLTSMSSTGTITKHRAAETAERLHPEVLPLTKATHVTVKSASPVYVNEVSTPYQNTLPTSTETVYQAQEQASNAEYLEIAGVPAPGTNAWKVSHWK